jgi:hypothetical protein
VIYYLLEFNYDDIDQNIIKVKSIREYLVDKQKELKRVADIYIFTEKKWQEFLQGLEIEEGTKIKFIEELEKQKQNVSESFDKNGFDDLSRLDEDSERLKGEVLKIIGLFKEIELYLENYVFIGDEAILIEDKMVKFLKEDFKEFSTFDIITFKKSIEEEISEVIKKSKFVEYKVEVVKLIHKNHPKVEYFSLKFDDYILEDSNNILDINLFNVEPLQKYIYLSEFPGNGIFRLSDIQENINISNKQFQSILEVEDKSFILFSIFSFMIFILGILTLSGNLNHMLFLFLSIFISFSFIYVLRFFVVYIGNKNKVKDFFVFKQINYYISSLGTDKFNYKRIKINILTNFKKIFKVER